MEQRYSKTFPPLVFDSVPCDVWPFRVVNGVQTEASKALEDLCRGGKRPTQGLQRDTLEDFEEALW